ncbi:histidine phosphatase family protein [Leptospira semungkisensis]|uniref:Histidine phosphatase family protein n=1 Tax=Leptospira semungkisensis TaxID=2484985 RepID=A0A4R9FMZ8_9LEPT|nr:histidine phosphatase family protein [Leptospira semungkisensis]
MRHASIDPQYHSRYIGKTDLSISEQGLLEIERVKEVLPSKFLEGKVYLSPSKQCLETYNALGKHEYTNPELKEELKEFDFGDIEGHRLQDLTNENLSQFQEWGNFHPEFHFPNGEKILSFTNRAEKFINLIRSSENKNILIVSHGGILSLLLCIFLRLPSSSYLNFQILPSTIVLLELYQTGQVALTGFIRCNSQRRCEWPG